MESNWTLANLQSVVTRAETTGGWVPFNLHHVCATNCPAESITPTTLDRFLAWLKPRSAITIRTTVRTVQQVLGGAVKPAVPPVAPPAPGGPGVNTVRNASLESATSTRDPERAGLLHLGRLRHQHGDGVPGAPTRTPAATPSGS